jgi:hypothetical protein
MVVLWGLALLFVLPQIGAAIALAVEGKEMITKRRPLMAAACFAGALVWGGLWLAGMWFCGTKGYEAILKAID